MKIYYNFSLSVALTTNQISAVWTKFIYVVEDYSRNISEKFCQTVCSKIEIKAYFHFSHYKSMETLSCHSDESIYATAIKHIFVEANIINISQSFSFISLMVSEEMIFEYFFANLAFLLPWQPIKFSGLDKIHMVGRGLLNEHFCKTFVKISAVRWQ